MLFAYLDLPPLPQRHIDSCIDNIKYIGKHPRLNEINKVREEVIRSTFLTNETTAWLIDQISSRFNPVASGLKEALFNITSYSEYRKDPEWWGTQMKHVDRHRNYAVNFYVDTGGDAVKTLWYSDDGEEVIAETVIEPFRWAVLKVNPTIHAVKGILPSRRRMFLSASILTSEIENFDEAEYFKGIVIPETIIS